MMLGMIILKVEIIQNFIQQGTKNVWSVMLIPDHGNTTENAKDR